MKLLRKKNNRVNSSNNLSAIHIEKNVAKGFGDIRGNGLFTEKIFIYTFILWGGSILLQIGLILLSLGKLPPQIPLFYSLPWGDSILTKPLFIWILPLNTLLWGIIDFSIIRKNKDRFINNILAGCLILVCFLSVFGLIKLIELLI